MINSRRLIGAPEVRTEIVATLTLSQEESDVRFGSKTDMCGAKRHVRFTPESDRKSGHRQPVMSALPPTADVGAATVDVR
jgi:hypothetical protein